QVRGGPIGVHHVDVQCTGDVATVEPAALEQDLATARRPGKKVVNLRLTRQQPRSAPGAFDDVDLPGPIALTGESDAAPVRRPGKPADVRVAREPALSAPVGPNDKQAAARACECQAPRVRRPGEVA